MNKNYIKNFDIIEKAIINYWFNCNFIIIEYFFSIIATIKTVIIDSTLINNVKVTHIIMKYYLKKDFNFN